MSKTIKALFAAGIMAASMTVTAYADPADLTTIAAEYLLSEEPESYEHLTRYAVEGAGIYRTIDDITPKDIAVDGCTVDMIAEDGGWSLITTADGIAYMHSDDLRKPYSDDDLEVLAHVICGEAQCYDDIEQLYVGSVVLNRVSDSRYPDSIRGVVFQRGQYACTWDGNYYRTPTARNWENARQLLEHGSILPVYVVYQSGARQGKGVYVHTKRHYYCY